MREFETLKQRQKQKPKHLSEEPFPAAAPRSNGLKRELNQAAKWQWLSYPYRPCLLRFIAGCPERFFLALFTGYVIADDRVTDCIACTSHGCRTAPSGLGLEHPRPYALRCHRLPSPPAREPSDNRQGKSCAGEASLVRQPVEGETERCSCCRSWSHPVHAGGPVS